MILGTGIDMIEVERVAFSAGRDSGFREMVFSKREIEYCESKASPFQHYAARFAAKEAFLKAIGRGWDSSLALHEIEIVNEVNGKPRLLLSGKTAETLESLEIRSIHVSLSHLKTYASAVVIVES
jgi:holo-[acyl-carrier protein] synthase